jgi:hypothetical protein
MLSQGFSARCLVPECSVGVPVGSDYVTRFSFPYFDMPEIAKGFELRERPDDKLPYDPKKMRGNETDASSTELKQVPETSVPAQADALATAHQIEPEAVIVPEADEQQNLILRG